MASPRLSYADQVMVCAEPGERTAQREREAACAQAGSAVSMLGLRAAVCRVLV